MALLSQMQRLMSTYHSVSRLTRSTWHHPARFRNCSIVHRCNEKLYVYHWNTNQFWKAPPPQVANGNAHLLEPIWFRTKSSSLDSGLGHFVCVHILFGACTLVQWWWASSRLGTVIALKEGIILFIADCAFVHQCWVCAQHALVACCCLPGAMSPLMRYVSISSLCGFIGSLSILILTHSSCCDFLANMTRFSCLLPSLAMGICSTIACTMVALKVYGENGEKVINELADKTASAQ